MAITIVSTPYEHTPGYNEQWHVASGTNVAQTNFKYVVRTIIDGETTTQKFSPRPDNNLLYFNPQRIVESYLRNDYQFDIDEPTPATNSIKKVIVAINEEYGSPVSGFTGSSGDYYVWNAAYNAHDFSAFTFTTPTGTDPAKELSLAPANGAYENSETIHFDQKYLMKTWHRGFGAAIIRVLYVYCYDSAGNLIQSAEIYNSYYDTSISDTYFLTTVNMSPYGLNLIETNHPALIGIKYDALLSVVPPATARYLYEWKTASGGTVSSNQGEVFIDDFCSNYDRYVVHFLNRLGNYDSFTFNLVSVDESKKEVKEYRNSPYYLNTSNKLVYVNSKGDRQNYSTVITNKITLNSDWVSDTTYAWLKDLFMSPSIKLEDASGNLYAVTCTMKDYKKRKVVNDKIFNVTVELEFDYQDIRQRG